MLRLAVATQQETFERIRDPLADRGIEVVPVRASERTLSLSDSDLPSVDAGLVFPSRLMEGGAVAAALDVPWVNDREAILTSRNKAEVLAALSAANIPVPETTLVSNPVDDDAVAAAAEDLQARAAVDSLVVKPNSTTRGVGVARADDPDSLLGVTDYLDLVHDFRATGDRSYLLQEYLPDARDYRAMIVDGEYAGAVERRLPEAETDAGKWKHNVHRGAVAEGISLPTEARDLAERAAAVLGIDYLGVDLLETEDRLVVNETNARPTVDDATKYEPGFYDRLASLIRQTAEA
ncbi:MULTISPECIES: ATP-grasp domain-containing protein [Halolamina]|uniref:Ribosomal protein S6--L-glutamate ligase n=1 Tax=Halolamina pelagica TaxID=699431 RepID=A0A1I5QMM0_9EURY|nr:MULTISPECIES: RimK family alpha-L-glutamate ligase [Halolamina]NHX35459.1 RimK family alpha-L-glutamate ligase [Halolamina sp. R1-12]SFP47509.1 ribosomal protein S6--L-glutamate ligase [Halolamina pelagica]